jgi:type I restriction enzyme S subunit
VSRKSVCLSEVAEINPKAIGHRPATDDQVDFVPMAALSETESKVFPSEQRKYGDVAKGYTDFIDGDVLIAKITPCFENGKAAQVHVSTGVGFGSTEFHVVRPDRSKLDVRYLTNFLRREEIIRSGEKRMTGSGGQRRVPKSFFEQLEIPLPPLAEQKRIAAILDKADEIRKKRELAIQKLDQLAESVFIEMFGDLQSNPKKWLSKPLVDVCYRPGEYGANVPSIEYDPNLPRYIRITDIQDNGTLTDKPVSPSGSADNWKRYALSPGDLLFARSGATVGKTFLYRTGDPPSVFAGYLIRFKPNPSLVSPDYLYTYTKTKAYSAWVLSKQRVVAQPNINAQQYGQELCIPIPPREEQEKFAQVLKNIKSIGTNFFNSDRAINCLRASLASNSFCSN